jgi:uncharacterized membrane protein (UPF0127 family)
MTKLSLWRAFLVLVAVAVAAGCSTDRESSEPAASADDVSGSPKGMSTVVVEVTSADGFRCELCLWLADDSSERLRGLSNVTDLGDPVGMAFVWDEPGDRRFVMIDTPLPLSIAWFDAAGTFVDDADMEPCLDGRAADCERYSAPVSSTVAIEMMLGELDAVGIGPGSTIEFVAGSEADACPAALVDPRS